MMSRQDGLLPLHMNIYIYEQEADTPGLTLVAWLFSISKGSVFMIQAPVVFLRSTHKPALRRKYIHWAGQSALRCTSRSLFGAREGSTSQNSNVC